MLRLVGVESDKCSYRVVFHFSTIWLKERDKSIYIFNYCYYIVSFLIREN